MRIKRHGGQITIRDRPAPFWALRVFLLAGGLAAIAMPLGLATNAGDLEPWERLVRQFSFDELTSVEMEQGTDDEGGLVWRPAVHLQSGELIRMSQLWSHDRAGMEEGISVLAATCGLRVVGEGIEA